MASAGPNSPGTLASDNSFGANAWTNPGNAASSNNSYATSSVSFLNDTEYLKATNFGFALSGTASIDGIVVEIEKSMGEFDNVSDTEVKIVKGGVVGSTDKAIVGNWETTDTYSTYGANNDLWGETWTEGDINAANFGVVIAASGSIGTPSVDHIRITVYYTASESFDPADKAPAFVKAQSAVQPIPVHRSSIVRSMEPTYAAPDVIMQASCYVRKPSPPPVPPTIRSGVAVGVLEPTMYADNQPNNGWYGVQARGVIPPPRRTQTGKTAYNPVPFPEQLPELGWNQPTRAQAPTLPPPRNRSSVVMPWLPGQQGAWAWQPWVKLEYKKNVLPGRGSVVIAKPIVWYPTEGPQRDLTCLAKSAIPPPIRGRTTIAQIPWEELNTFQPARWGFVNARSVHPEKRGSGAKLSHVQLISGTEIYDGVAAIVSQPRLLPSRGSSWFSIPDSGWRTFGESAVVTRGKTHVYSRPSQTLIQPLETLSTGIIPIGWLKPLMCNVPRLLIRGSFSQVFETLLGDVSTATRKDDRDSRGGAGMSATSSGGSGRNRSSRGTGTGV